MKIAVIIGMKIIPGRKISGKDQRALDPLPEEVVADQIAIVLQPDEVGWLIVEKPSSVKLRRSEL